MGKRQLTGTVFLIIIFLMKTLLFFYNTHKKNFYLTVGLVLACFLMVPFLLLGTGSIITYHDQLDGELFNYILAAKYLFTNIRIYPEIMNGLPAAGAVPPAPLFIMLYVFFKPFTAFMLSQWIIYLIAFTGMYLLLLKLTDREFISFGISVIFMLLPFYPVYGLCIPGQPLLFYAVLSLFHEESLSMAARTDLSPHNSKFSFQKYRTIFYYFLVLFYGISSSLVLVGFACLLVLGLFAVIKSITALRQKKRIPFSPWFSLGVLLASYIITNLGLIRQVLFPESTYVSHKTELLLSSQDPLQCLKEVFGTGVPYAQSYHTVLFFLIALCLLRLLAGFLSQIRKPFHSENPLIKAAWTFLFIFMVCLFTAFYHGNFMTDIRNTSDGILKTFNLDRICWLLPTVWCILAGYLLSYIAGSGKNISSSMPSLKFCLRQGIIFAVLGIWGITALLHSPLRLNLSKLAKGGDYYELDWNRFFAEDIFCQIEEVIGEPKESYHVVSVGIYPAAAAYNGFYCLDGYSNNYPLNYKHIFRQIIEGELNKNDYVRTLFDDWGNRCYITTAEYSNYYTFEKKWNNVIYDLDLDTNVLKDLNCRYIFSAAYVMNAEEKGLSLLQEAPFETEDSWYHIYVYVVE
ncbi:MAG: hypothetical protein HDQ96_09660 [Lachnospiraceae bacterium]|nr:hypothetical protein [Lachnospiraceae bacterium]